jgi:hypothetical protein
MALTQIHQGNFRTYTFSYIKADGTPGTVEKVNSVSLDNPSLGVISRQELSADASSLAVDIAWAGSGLAKLTVDADGDLTPDGEAGAGNFPIVVVEDIDFVAPLGATSSTVTIGEETPIPV